jgi:hypothetical protein
MMLMIDDIPEVHADSEIAHDDNTQSGVNHDDEAMVSHPKKSNEEKNFAALRQKAEKAEYERDLALKRLQELEQQSEESDDLSIDDEDIADGKHLKKIQKSTAREFKKLKEELYTYKRQAELASTEARIKSTYHDFDDIVNADNLAALRESHPALATSIQSSPDLYTQAVTAYTMIKNLGLAPDKQQVAEKQRAHNNLYKPRPATSVSPQQGDNPLTRANAFADGLTDELKEQLRKEMYSSIRNNN